MSMGLIKRLTRSEVDQGYKFFPFLLIVLAIFGIYAEILSTTTVIFIAIWILFLMYVVIPVVVYRYPTIFKELIFLSTIRIEDISLKQPESGNFFGVRNFYLEQEKDLKLGVWHVLPKDLIPPLKNNSSEEYYMESLKSGHPVVLYFHGNGGTRSTGHRLDYYKLIRNLNIHIISVDYQDYGDSTRIRPTEEGVVSNANFMIQWVKERINENTTFIVWGHSLGTAICSHALSTINPEYLPDGLVLESAFNNVFEAALLHFLFKPYLWIPSFKSFMKNALDEQNVHFATDKHIAKIPIPILILHSEDDFILPIGLAEKLYESALTTRPAHSKEVKFVKVKSELRLGHNYIIELPDFPNILRSFLENCRQIT